MNNIERMDAAAARLKADLAMTTNAGNLDAFLGALLDDYKAEAITKDQAITAMTYLAAALYDGQLVVASVWLEQGRKVVRPGRPAHD